MRITFAGAADTVTGSCHLVELSDQRILLDCGYFQGPKKIERRNRRDFPFDPASVDRVLVTHAHLDHVGRLPLLQKLGFKGRIVSTPATRELARVILLDAAHIQAADAERARRKGLGDDADLHWPALYDEEDVHNCLDRWIGAADYDEPIDLAPGVRAVFRDAGHIMGSSFIELEHRQNGSVRRLTFSGDLGNVDKPLVRDPSSRHAGADALLLESTYGDRKHRPFAESVVELEAVITETFERGGVAVIPSFALERAQELLFVLFQMQEAGTLGNARIYLDSPMAIKVTEIFTRFPECYDEETLAVALRRGNPFRFPNLRFTRSVDESKRINDDAGPCIIVAASGMCTGGRVVHHLRRRLSDSRNSIVFIGYQAVGTLGRLIVEGRETVRMFGRDIPVEASIHTIGGFSGHAGQDTLVEWLASAELPEHLFLVHGEEDSIEALRARIQADHGLTGRDPGYGQTVEI
jgi:metallo-beta-lactamase family protein